MIGSMSGGVFEEGVVFVDEGFILDGTGTRKSRYR